MQIIRYGRGPLLKLAGAMALGAAFFAWVLASPETFRAMEGRRSGMAHLLADYPLIALGFLLFLGGFAARMVQLCLGDRLALAVTPGGLDIRTIGGRHRPAWSEIAGVELSARQVARTVQHVLIVHVRRGLGTRKLSLSAGLIEGGEDALACAAADIEHGATLARQDAARPPIAAPAGALATGFGRKGL